MTSDELQRLQELYDRADANKRRSSRALIVSMVALAITIAIALGGIVAANFAKNNQDLLEGQSTALKKINEIVGGLQQAESQRSEVSKDQALAFAVVLENIAAGFATPPAPDPSRLKAVQGLCDTARTFRAAAGDDHPPPCPTP